MMTLRDAALSALKMLVLSAAAHPAASPAAEADNSRATNCERVCVSDYQRLQLISQLEMSPSGEIITFVTQRIHPSFGGSEGFVAKNSPAGWKVLRVRALDDAREIHWIGNDIIAFVNGSADNITWAYSITTGTTSALFKAKRPVKFLRINGDGSEIVYVNESANVQGVPFQARLQTETSPIRVDVNDLELYHFVDPNRALKSSVSPDSSIMRLYTRRGDREIRVPGTPIDATWSPDGSRVSVAYRHPCLNGSSTSSVGIMTFKANAFRIIAKGDCKYSFLGGEFAGRDSIWLRRRHLSEKYVTSPFPDIARYRLDRSASAVPIKWREINDRGLVIAPMTSERSLVEHVRQGRMGLSYLHADGRTSPFTLNVANGSNSKFSFSSNRQTAAFVHESLARPPEVYVYGRGGNAQPITRLNSSIGSKIKHSSQAVSWQNVDGTSGNGWLIKPNSPGPYPTIVMVHGGPASAILDSFAPYFSKWPYPLDVLVDRGIAVFIPNYRGDNGYDGAHATPSAIDEEPPEDILGGINELVARGVIDRSLLGLAGHSHGGWLAPLIMTRHPHLFKTASFAEGWGNFATVYDTLSSGRNRSLHDLQIGAGASLYSDPSRYIARSPALNFGKVKVPLFLEAGAYSMGLYMMGYAKAAKYYGIPADFYIYPQEGHNLRRTSSILQSAEYNFDWFRFWLQGHTESEPVKAEQYRRWQSFHGALERGARVGVPRG